MKVPFDNALHGNLSNKTRSFFFIVIGVAVNVLLSYLMYRLGLPLYLDTIGTLVVSAISGMLFAGIITAVVSSVVCSFFNETALYMAFCYALIAIGTVWFVRKYTLKKIGKLILFILAISAFSAVTSSLIQFLLLGQNQEAVVAQNARSLSAAVNIPYLIALIVIYFVMHILDYSGAAIIILLIVKIIPEEKLAGLEVGAWMQRPLSDRELKSIKEMRKGVKHSLRFRTAFTLVLTSLLVMLVTSWTGLRLYFNNQKIDRTQKAWNAVKAASEVIDPNKVEDFLIYGTKDPLYEQTASMLDKIWYSSTDVSYLYVLKPELDGGRFIFDVDVREGMDKTVEPYNPGQLVPYEPEILEHLDSFLSGEEIPPLETRDRWGWLLTVFYPLRDSSGKCVCYVGADISLEYMADYMGTFFIKVLMTMMGFFILIVAYALWKTGVYTSFPISSMTACVERFAHSGEDQEKLDENVRLIRSLDIHTGDEVEKLYRAICKMTLNQAEQMRDIRHLSDSTAKMQDGLIITMADMVESRDSDTGAHVQKTAAYVKIIVEGLKKKGYYIQKITPKFMSDVVRSAPLHDVGKINISDGVLNKPGKLTDEEFEIMKTHTTAGKKLLENAISTVQGENYLKEARNMAAYHHERWDGKGYPEGLHGEVIPLSARIMAVADVFDALTSPRVYKPAFPLEKALSILQEGAGTQFDAKCVEVFMDSLPEVKVILKKYNSTL